MHGAVRRGIAICNVLRCASMHASVMYCAVHLFMDVVGRVRSDPRIVVCLHFANRPSPLLGSCDTFTATLYIVHMIRDNDGFVKCILFRVIVGIYFLDRS